MFDCENCWYYDYDEEYDEYACRQSGQQSDDHIRENPGKDQNAAKEGAAFQRAVDDAGKDKADCKMPQHHPEGKDKGPADACPEGLVRKSLEIILQANKFPFVNQVCVKEAYV